MELLSYYCTVPMYIILMLMVMCTAVYLLVFLVCVLLIKLYDRE